MLDFFEWGQALITMLSEVGDFLLHKPFYTFIDWFRVIDYIDILGLVPSSLYDTLMAKLDFTIGEFTSSGKGRGKFRIVVVTFSLRSFFNG